MSLAWDSVQFLTTFFSFGIYKLDTVVFGQSGIWLDTGVDSWKVSKEDANKFRLMLIGLI